jgi:hypothetical protein
MKFRIDNFSLMDLALLYIIMRILLGLYWWFAILNPRIEINHLHYYFGCK